MCEFLPQLFPYKTFAYVDMYRITSNRAPGGSIFSIDLWEGGCIIRGNTVVLVMAFIQYTLLECSL